MPNESLQLMYANALLHAGKTDAAIAVLTPLSKNASNRLHFAADWYIAVAYLKADNRAAARQELEKIVAMHTQDGYLKEAKNLLQKL